MTMELEAHIISNTAVLADNYDDSDTTFEQESWRFKHSDSIGKSELNTLRHEDFVQKDESAWNNSATTWEWTEQYYDTLDYIEQTDVVDCSHEMLDVMRRHGDIVAELPLYETFEASEYSLIGKMKVLSGSGIVEMVEDYESSGPATWKLSDDARRVFEQMLFVHLQQ